MPALQTYEGRLLFDRRHTVYNSPQARRTVIIVSLSQLQNCSESIEATAGRKNLFCRILIDEAWSIHRCMATKQGRILYSFEAAFPGLFTGSLVVDSILDLAGHLSFLEHPHWSASQDTNQVLRTPERQSRYAAFRMKKHSSHPKAEPFAEDTDWHSDCESVDGPLADQVKAKVEEGWKCSHFPVGLRYNGNRPRSLERRSKRRSSKDAAPLLLDEDIAILTRRVQVILEILALSRNLFSTTNTPDGSELAVADEIPAATI
ncbi:hypothetical protein HBI56_142330 [Parastagonospora nodorum]|nr:hypothetical protein HBH54_064710 [Parastagonospora nodorum]KAH4001993.1 hypothetical protein HBI10_081680 [Parastagonospora nodorum]KAH4047204.1 hypothetical protein HBH49_170980 [Parastagonospora nodorum]KAH4075795.1 hypothetical protein HBH50_021720 [Parastagonospora nodorum]KAH4142994.1 hypothetical protein HBH45_045680 [Parastagonospora nodorum]